MIRRAAILALLLALGGCANEPRALPAPAASATAPTIVPPPPVALDWRDLPPTPGTWRYAADLASVAYGVARQPPVLLMRCDRASRRVILSRPGGAAGAMTIRTSYSEQSWPAVAEGDGAAISLAAGDAVLDRIAFSRGHFTVALPGAATLVLPARAEPARVVEDCRS